MRSSPVTGSPAKQRLVSSERRPGERGHVGAVALKKEQRPRKRLQGSPRAAALAGAQAPSKPRHPGSCAAQGSAGAARGSRPAARRSTRPRADLETLPARGRAWRRSRGPQLPCGLRSCGLGSCCIPSAVTLDAGRDDDAKAVRRIWRRLLRRGAPAGQIDSELARPQGCRPRFAPSAAQCKSDLTAGLRSAERSPDCSPRRVRRRCLDSDCTVADLSHLRRRVDLSELDIAKVGDGDAALVRVDALGGSR